MNLASRQEKAACPATLKLSLQGLVSNTGDMFSPSSWKWQQRTGQQGKQGVCRVSLPKHQGKGLIWRWASATRRTVLLGPRTGRTPFEVQWPTGLADGAMVGLDLWAVRVQLCRALQVPRTRCGYSVRGQGRLQVVALPLPMIEFRVHGWTK